MPNMYASHYCVVALFLFQPIRNGILLLSNLTVLWLVGPQGRPGLLPCSAYRKVLSWVLCSTLSILQILAAGAILSQSYADDLQLYVHCLASAAAAAVREISRFMQTLEVW